MLGTRVAGGLGRALLVTLCSVGAVCGLARDASAVVVWTEDFGADSISSYTPLEIYYNPGASQGRLPGEWSVADGRLQVFTAFESFQHYRNGMLAIEGPDGEPLETPDWFRISYDYHPDNEAFGGQKHPAIGFDRTDDEAHELYFRLHSNEVVGLTTVAGGGVRGAGSVGVNGLDLFGSYRLVFEVDYLTQTAVASAYSLGDGSLITSAVIAPAGFASFGPNAGGAFGIVGFYSEGSSIDNLVVEVFSTAIPEPRSALLLAVGAAIPALRVRGKTLRGPESISRGASLGLAVDGGVVGSPATFSGCRTSSSLPSTAIPSRCTREPIDSGPLSSE